jgi:hypothetical protein
MKKALAALVVLASLCAPSLAQTRGFRASVPFAFSVGGRTFAPGTYQFQRPLGKPSAESAVGMIAVRGLDGSAYAATMTSLARPAGASPKDCRLVFKKRAGQWLLSQVWIGGDGQGQQLPGISQGDDVVASNEPEMAIAELR